MARTRALERSWIFLPAGRRRGGLAAALRRVRGDPHRSQCRGSDPVSTGAGAVSGSGTLVACCLEYARR
ncbi:hypothetical protein GCM10010319_08570 [Streptomyces blastmyceticus]|uniref:Uncharacterized protein n=1 Tax=Streptomyces blastmyceticus TaxID=68180 RepID=A0ABN0WEX4_9ACTN